MISYFIHNKTLQMSKKKILNTILRIGTHIRTLKSEFVINR